MVNVDDHGGVAAAASAAADVASAVAGSTGLQKMLRQGVFVLVAMMMSPTALTCMGMMNFRKEGEAKAKPKIAGLFGALYPSPSPP